MNRVLALGLLFFGVLGACTKKPSSPDSARAEEPKIIKVQHILIGFKGTLPGESIERTQEEASKLAQEVFEKAKAGAVDFEALVKEFSNDRPPGVYEMVNRGQAVEGNAFPREQMVPAFGDIGFKLKVGEVGLAPYDPKVSPFGFHIIKRLN